MVLIAMVPIGLTVLDTRNMVERIPTLTRGVLVSPANVPITANIEIITLSDHLEDIIMKVFVLHFISTF